MHRTRPTLITLSAVAVILLAGCAVPAAEAPAHARLASTEAEDARDALLGLTSDAAAAVGGSAEPFERLATDCLPGMGEGVMFNYSVAVPAEAADRAVLEGVASMWEAAGVEVTQTDTSVKAKGLPTDGTNGPVAYVRMIHQPTYGSDPAHYEIGGYSLCSEGTPEEHADFNTLNTPH